MDVRKLEYNHDLIYEQFQAFYYGLLCGECRAQATEFIRGHGLLCPHCVVGHEARRSPQHDSLRAMDLAPQQMISRLSSLEQQQNLGRVIRDSIDRVIGQLHAAKEKINREMSTPKYTEGYLDVATEVFEAKNMLIREDSETCLKGLERLQNAVKRYEHELQASRERFQTWQGIIHGRINAVFARIEAGVLEVEQLPRTL